MSSYTLRYTLAPEMQHRAMMSWAKPLRSRRQKVLRAVAGVALWLLCVTFLVVLMQRDLLRDATPLLLAGGFLAGLGLCWGIARYSTAQLSGMARESLLRHGELNAVFAPDHVVITSALSASTMDWRCFDAVTALPDASVLRAGALVYAIPDTALPAGSTPEGFRADLTRWMEAAR